MPQERLISLIIPVYNAEKYLRRCIDSAVNQSYRPLEIVLVDDGSTDGSAAICDDYVSRYPFVKGCHIPNGGASYARKKGLELLNGEYVIFMDSDDFIEPDYVTMLYAALQEQGSVIAACDFIKHGENEKVEIDRKKNLRLLDEKELHERFFRYEFWGFGGKIYLKSVFDNIYFPEATINEDYVVMAQLFHRYKQMAYIDIPLYHYMVHGESLSNTRLSTRMMEEWENKQWCYDFYRTNAPEWSKQAEAQAAETCCKLIAAIGNSSEYSEQKRDMQKFLRKHILSLLCNKHLLIGLKGMVVWRIL